MAEVLKSSSVLDSSQALNALVAYKRHLSPSSHELLEKIAGQLDATSHQANVAAVLDVVFPGDEAAANKLSKLCAHLAAASQDHGFDLRLVQLGAKKLGAARRLLQFEGAPVISAVPELRVLAQVQNTGALIPDLQAGRPSAERVIRLTEKRGGKPLVKWFFSYAHADNPAATALFTELKKRLALSKNYAFEPWLDNEQLLPGDQWRQSIDKALTECNFGLLAVSYSFLNSGFIKSVELPPFVARRAGEITLGKRVVPLLFQKLNFSLDDLGGLEELQFFKDKNERAYSELREKRDREAWVDALRQQIEGMLKRYALVVNEDEAISANTKAQSPASESKKKASHQGNLTTGSESAEEDDSLESDDSCSEAWLDMGQQPQRPLDRVISDASAKRTHLTKGARLPVADADPEQLTTSVDALKTLLDWAKDPNSRPLFALLGEYGTGKTTTCQRLTDAMLEAHLKEPALLQPLYFDLRQVTGLRHLKGQMPPLEAILQDCINTGWRAQPGQNKPKAAELLTLINRGALVIYDGLDECLVHLTESDGLAFTRVLTSVLPARLKTDWQTSPPSRTRVLMSCRNEFFRSFRDEQTQLTGQDRSDQGAEMFEALQLLPLTQEQVRFYLQHAVKGQASDAEIDRFMALVASVHNLTELTQRPYTLKLVAQLIPRIDALVASGQRVHGVTLYREMMLSLLERDAGKHQLDKSYKLSLAASLAAYMWREGLRVVESSELDSWYQQWFYADELLKNRYQQESMDKLLEDLRNSTFLVRQDNTDPKTGETHSLGFRFGHSSQQEYFLACYLFDALTDNQPQRWAMPIPSTETLEFLGQLLQEAEERQTFEAGQSSRRSKFQTAMTSLGTIRDTYQPQSSELAWAYAMVAHHKNYPLHALDGIQLPGIDWSFKSCGVMGKRLGLRGANFAGAQLQGCSFVDIDFDGVNFSDAWLMRTTFEQCSARDSRWAGADFSGGICRDTALDGAALDGIQVMGADFVRASLDVGQTEGLGDAGACIANLDAKAALIPLHVAFDFGHQEGVRCVCFSPNGRQLASASDDGTLRLWEAASGNMLQVIEVRQQDGISCVCFSPDGRQLVSAGDDGILCLWEVGSGKALQVIEVGHRDGIVSVCFSPNGRQLASASIDKTLRLWEIGSGKVLLVIEGQQGLVHTVRFSPDSSQLVSAGQDGTLRLWGAASGKALQVLKGHRGWVTSVSFSPDGMQLVSAGDDGTLRLWAVASGKALRVIKGGQGRLNSVSFSPDGKQLVSAGRDGTLRLWEIASGKALQVIEGHQGLVNSVSFSPDGRQLASASRDWTLRLWEVVSGKALQVIEGHQVWVANVSFSPDGLKLVCAGRDGLLRLWDVVTGKALKVIDSHNKGGLTSVSFSPNGMQLVGSDDDGFLHLWDTASGNVLQVISAHEGGVTSVSFSPDGRQLASTGVNGALCLWDSSSGKVLQVIEGEQGICSCICFRFDGRQLASASMDGVLRLWEVASEKVLQAIDFSHSDGSNCVCFSPDGRLLASGHDDGIVHLWGAASCKALRIMEGHQGWVNSVSFSPDGKQLASASDDCTLRLWEVTSGKALQVIECQQGWVRGVSFSPDGKQLASAGDDGTLRLWDAATGECLSIMANLPEGESAHLSPDMKTIHSASPGAWKYLRWLGQNPVTGQRESLPAEMFGPLPAMAA